MMHSKGNTGMMKITPNKTKGMSKRNSQMKLKHMWKRQRVGTKMENKQHQKVSLANSKTFENPDIYDGGRCF